VKTFLQILPGLILIVVALAVACFVLEHGDL